MSTNALLGSEAGGSMYLFSMELGSVPAALIVRSIPDLWSACGHLRKAHPRWSQEGRSNPWAASFGRYNR
ncbi:hypothetical protein BJX68DRAFT_232794 [Aspergillus pseudodeflectus]|uniref:Uncharacterized protein n=1 Tax=Aspergillus pseudodeflectus TaxID=176178 RepID=A0ABR4KP87_9EURO